MKRFIVIFFILIPFLAFSQISFPPSQNKAIPPVKIKPDTMTKMPPMKELEDLWERRSH